MVDDQLDARPQSGLSSADVVWQAPAEGGIPRYMALFQTGSPKAVGPVRSSRYYFIAWAAEWRSVYVHVGGSPQALALLRSSKGKGPVVYDADGFRYEGTLPVADHHPVRARTTCTPTPRTSGRWARRSARRRSSYKSPWKFGPDKLLSLRPKGGSLVVPYLANRITYKYDRKTNSYLRSVTGESKQTDASSKKRVAPKNVVVMVVAFGALNDGSQKHRLEAQFKGKGVAWIATGGKTIKGEWRKKTMTAPTRFYDKHGKQVTLTAGPDVHPGDPQGLQADDQAGQGPEARNTGGHGNRGALVE